MGITTIDFEAANRTTDDNGKVRRPVEGTHESPVADVIQWFLDYYWIRHPICNATLEHYQRDLQTAAQWLASSRQKTLVTASEQDLRAYICARHGSGGALASLPSLACIRRFYFYLVEVGIRLDDPTEHLYVRTPELVQHSLRVVSGKHN